MTIYEAKPFIDDSTFFTVRPHISLGFRGIVTLWPIQIPDHIYCERAAKGALPSFSLQYGFDAEVSIPANFSIAPVPSSTSRGYLFYTSVIPASLRRSPKEERIMGAPGVL